ncbi:sigma-54-dependent transcriptional regulator [Hyphomonas adhaerens]|uniref:Sigma-54 dependent DNA-binding response regulator n=2 Tax=Hyphomonas adhaerens TaxID=81029 RepID=A0A069E775_9PROT|nr:sigma-54 dependent transcriptional regulator [Hyphomonas adhaerens]KCZ83457.1 sigma-54 dependent DNA-binding response regulator [Hyphomonas adhaerens MHS-3]HAE28968.1 sigma-54-dependent Fis family transcriptional regulator [Hyphomonas adhaerens]|tara:strand:- start:6000 stop:7385 length:1386 start_codon:yes stop_codon:yes gene_type:complete
MALDILVVDDEPDIRELIAGVLGDEGYSVRTAATAEAALEEVRTRTPRLVVLDVWLQGSGMDGLSLLKYLKSIDPLLPVIVISGHGNIETAVAAIRRGAYDFIEKPFKTDRLLHLIDRAIESAALKYENATLRNRAGDDERWIGHSNAAANLRASIEKVAPTNSRVMITGPAGVGKELAARLIHRNSLRENGPFIVVNAATIAPDQMEIALFGEEDAQGRTTRIGLFEKAHLGTLLLDEVADMPPGTQSKILRVLTEQRFQRVGGRSDVSVDVRVMSATTKDLKQEIEESRFREDLYYRLNVVPLRVPSLAERRDDIADLVDYFIARIADSSGLTPRTFSQEAMAVLQSMEWPGNIRQLRNVVERILILSPSDSSRPVSVDELPRDVGSNVQTAKAGSADLVGLSLRDAREQFEREYLALQITRFNGNISRTAEFIGMERSALHRKLKALGVASGTSRQDS